MIKLLLFTSFISSLAQAALVDPQLQRFAQQNQGTTKVLVLMDFKPTRALPAGVRSGFVKNYLKQEMQIAWSRTQGQMQPLIAQQQVRIISQHAISQSFYAEVTPQGLKALSVMPGLSKIYADRKVISIAPVSRQPVTRFFENMPYDLIQMGMDQLNQKMPQLDGRGVMVGHIDTGVDGKHPALAGKIALFFDAASGKRTEPIDKDTHGTHTAGTIVGAPRGGFPMGVAPGAKLISSGALTGYNDMLLAMEFMLDPDGRPETNDAPRLVSNSWNCEGAPDLEAFYRAINAWEAAGILTVFSAGNSGPGAQTITKPHEHPLTLAVGAVDQKAKIASFSSRGPGIFNGQKTAKPDVSAPGVAIVSSVPGGRYEVSSGTSMAAPHVAGLAALLYQLNPQLTPAKMREIITVSSIDVDEKGDPIQTMRWNASYGYGVINAVKAVEMLTGFRFSVAERILSSAFDLGRGDKSVSIFNFEQDSLTQSDSLSVLQTEFVTPTQNWLTSEDIH